MANVSQVAHSGRTSGNRIVSRMPRPVSAISSRSMPMPMPPRRRHAVLERAQELLVEAHRLVVAAARASFACSVNRSRWIDRVDELGVAGRQLEPADVEVPLLDDARRCSGAAHIAGSCRPGSPSRTSARSSLSPTKCSHSSSTSLPCRALRVHLQADRRGELAQQSSSGVCGVISSPSASDSESYIEIARPLAAEVVLGAVGQRDDHACRTPPRAASWTSSWVSAADPVVVAYASYASSIANSGDAWSRRPRCGSCG